MKNAAIISDAARLICRYTCYLPLSLNEKYDDIINIYVI